MVAFLYFIDEEKSCCQASCQTRRYILIRNRKIYSIYTQPIPFSYSKLRLDCFPPQSLYIP
jgi:hypothetical protein